MLYEVITVAVRVRPDGAAHPAAVRRAGDGGDPEGGVHRLPDPEPQGRVHGRRRHRITSYNVCYTKLLRVFQYAGFDQVFEIV